MDDDLFQSTCARVEGAIRRVGVDAEKARAKRDADQATWTMSRGSAFVLVSVMKRPEQNAVFFRIVCPVIQLPAAENRPALFEHLLELNAAGLVNSAFGVIGDRVVVVSERPCAHLDEPEIEQMLKHTSAVADTFDDRLAREYGATSA